MWSSSLATLFFDEIGLTSDSWNLDVELLTTDASNRSSTDHNPTSEMLAAASPMMLSTGLTAGRHSAARSAEAEARRELSFT